MALGQTEEMSIRNPDLMHLVNLKSKGTNLDSELGHLWERIRMEKVSGIPENKNLSVLKSGACEQDRTQRTQWVNSLAAKPDSLS